MSGLKRGNSRNFSIGNRGNWVGQNGLYDKMTRPNVCLLGGKCEYLWTTHHGSEIAAHFSAKIRKSTFYAFRYRQPPSPSLRHAAQSCKVSRITETLRSICSAGTSSVTPIKKPLRSPAC